MTSRAKVDDIEQVGLQVFAQLVERGAIKTRAGKPLVGIFADKRMTRKGDLFFQCEDLAFDRAFLCLQIATDTCIENCPLHMA
jgi:hypothetical protein